MDRKTYAIGILFLSALALFLAICFVPNRADAQATVKERVYSVVTARVQQGGDALYIVDNETGLMAVFTYDPNSRSLRPRAVRNVVDAFAQPR
jgi:hypothetical protein